MTVGNWSTTSSAPPVPDPSLLDNPVWHSLTGARRSHGVVTAGAGRFAPDVAPFAAVEDDPGPSAWSALTELVGAGKKTTLFRSGLELGPGWSEVVRIPCVQMVATDVAAVDDESLVPLGPADVPEMLALVAATRPGPFLPRTVELGGYIGVREGDRLVAMAGERLRLPGYTEISAVCSLDSYRGRGLGTTLVLALVQRIRGRGEEGFLHASTTNENAIRLYRALGFEVRREIDALVVAAPGSD